MIHIHESTRTSNKQILLPLLLTQCIARRILDNLNCLPFVKHPICIFILLTQRKRYIPEFFLVSSFFRISNHPIAKNIFELFDNSDYEKLSKFMRAPALDSYLFLCIRMHTILVAVISVSEKTIFSLSLSRRLRQQDVGQRSFALR